jgi:hypothetical protein
MFKKKGFTTSNLTMEQKGRALNKIISLISIAEMQYGHRQIAISKEMTKRFLPKDRTLIRRELKNSHAERKGLEDLWYLRRKLESHSLHEDDLPLLNMYLYETKWRLF